MNMRWQRFAAAMRALSPSVSRLRREPSGQSERMESTGRRLRVCIDATNIRSGGGLTHLSQLLAAGVPSASGIEAVIVVCSAATGRVLPERPWLSKQTPDWAGAGPIRRFIGQQLRVHGHIRRWSCDVLFSPGGTVPVRSAVPVVTMSQNMLPFEPAEAKRFGYLSFMWLKMKLLRVSQGASFRRADGVIFLTNYARSTVGRVLGDLRCPVALIPHGIESRFSSQFLASTQLVGFAQQRPFRLLYVSIFMPYKHQLEVMRAVWNLRQRGTPLELTLIGSSWGDYGRKVRDFARQLDPSGEYIRVLGHVAFDTLHLSYHGADGFVFASSCENLPNILIEAMSAGLPIACSDRGPMPEVLGDGGIYFDPDSVESISDCLLMLASDAALRYRLAVRARTLSERYSWTECANSTFDFLASVARESRQDF